MAFIDSTSMHALRHLEERERIVLSKLKEHGALQNAPKSPKEIGLTSQDMRTLKRLMSSDLAGKTKDDKYYIADKGLEKIK